MDDKRIVLLGKTGAGKSSLSNTIFEENVFEINHTANSGTSKCQKESKLINGRNITLIDTPGFFGSEGSTDELKSEIVSCITECSPGPHAFLILLKVEKFTEHENQVVEEILQSFSVEAFKYAAVVFTHGDQLHEGQTIEMFVQENEGLCNLLKKCGNRCHVFDNKYWNNNQQDEFRNNKIQLEKLLNTIDKMVKDNGGGCYTNEMLQAVEKQIQQEENNIRQSFTTMSKEEIREMAKIKISNVLKKAAGITTGMLLGALLGIPFMILTVVSSLIAAASIPELVEVGVIAVGGGAATATGLAVAAGVTAGIGAAVGGYTGYKEADQADSVSEAVENTAKAVFKGTLRPLKKLQKTLQQQSEEDCLPLL